MEHVALTGAGGFLGWHTRSALLEQTIKASPISLGKHFDLSETSSAINGSTRLIHLAGVNRGPDSEVREGNLLFARQLAASLARTTDPPRMVVFANSTQSRHDNVYGRAKSEAAEILAAAATKVGADFMDVILPNLFGEHGRPFYNAVTATFCHLLAVAEQPIVAQNKELTLMHAQDAADLLLGRVTADEQRELEVQETVLGLLDRLSSFAALYSRGEIPDISAKFDRDLFNTYRSYTVSSQTPISLARHADRRGSFFEIVRSHGGSGQSSFSTTAASVSRGDHFHRRKVERFTVLAGSATISLRKLFTNDILEFAVTGSEPVAIDMPTMWAHKIVNTGDDDLYTSFWANEIFNPAAPDTIAEAV